MRKPTDKEVKQYRYLVNLTIRVERTDNEMLTDEENSMVTEMQVAAEKVIGEIMKAHGSNNQKHLGRERIIY